MTTMTDEIVVTASQLAVFAGNVNDRRVITEARELATQCEVDPDLVTAIRYIPASPPRMARIVFTLFVTQDIVDEDGDRAGTERVRVHDDGTPYDAERAAAGMGWRYVTEDFEFKYRGQGSPMPHWWEQAAKTVVPTIEETPS